MIRMIRKRSPRPSKPAAEPSEEPSEKRKLLLKAAFDEVAERGFSAVTLEDIAERAGVSKGVTLYYFESKEALFRELFQWVIEGLHGRMKEATREGDARARLVGLVNVIFTSPARNRAFFSVYTDFCSLSVRHESFRKVNERFYGGCRTLEREIIELGIAQGLFPPQDPDRAAMILRSLFDGLMLRWLAEPDPEAAFARYRETCLEELFQRLRGTNPESPRPTMSGRRSHARSEAPRSKPSRAR